MSRVTPATPVTIDVSEDAPAANGRITVVIVAFQAVGTQNQPIAYSIRKDVQYTPTGSIPPLETFGAWQTDFTNVSLRIAAIPAGFNATTGGASIRQYSQNSYLTLNSYSQPASFGSAPLDFGMSIIPSISDEYGMIGTLTDTPNKSILAVIRKTPTLPSLTSWNPVASGMAKVANIQTDPAVSATAPRFKWTQSGSMIGIADMAMIATGWTSGGKNFNWYSLTSPESIDAASAYQFPKLPAAYAGYVPPAGTVFTNALVLYGDYSNLDSYDAFIQQENLHALTFKLAAGQVIDLNLSGSQGTP